MRKFRISLTRKRYRSANASSFILTLFLMMALVSSGSAVSIEHSYEHAHSMSVMTAQSDAAHANHQVRMPESANTHCQHQELSSQHADLSAKNSKSKPARFDGVQVSDAGVKSVKASQMSDMPCCKDECNCPADHCFNLSASALIQPTVETEISVARMAATAPILGQRSSPHFGQFRPPKTLFTA